MKFKFPNSEEPYPEMHEFEWAKDYDNMRDASIAKYGKNRGEGRDSNNIPLTVILDVVRDTMSRPEIVECIAINSSKTTTEDEKDRVRFITTWFREYLSYKYGNWAAPVMASFIPVKRLVSGEYESMDDPQLINDLLKRPVVHDDRGK